MPPITPPVMTRRLRSVCPLRPIAATVETYRPGPHSGCSGRSRRGLSGDSPGRGVRGTGETIAGQLPRQALGGWPCEGSPMRAVVVREYGGPEVLTVAD